MARLVVVSDTHLSPGDAPASAHWDAVVAHVAEARPDLVLHAGDVTLDGANEASHLNEGRRQLDRLGAPWRAVPGNHDIGDTPPTAGGGDAAVNDSRRRSWTDHIGAPWWSTRLDGWALLGVDIQIMGSGLDAEAEQWKWLASTLSDAGTTTPVALVMHRPVAPSPQELIRAPRRFVSAVAAQRIEELSAGADVRLVLSGHVHQFLLDEKRRPCRVWAPTTWAVLPADRQPTYGVRRSGILSLTLLPGGGFGVERLEPRGMAQLTVGSDISDPYHS